MHRARLLLIAFSLCFAVPGAGQATEDDIGVVLVATLRAHGCAMTIAEALTAFDQIGLPPEMVFPAVDLMVERSEGFLTPDLTMMLLTPEICSQTPAVPSNPAADDAAAWIEASLAEQRNCDARLEEVLSDGEDPRFPAWVLQE